MQFTRFFVVFALVAGCLSSAGAAPITITKPPPTVTLLDAGQEPRKELRLKFVEGATQRVVMSMKMSQKVSIDGENTPSQAIPPIIETLDIQIDAVGLDGEARASMVVVDVHADPDAKGTDPVVVAMMNDAYANVVGFSMTFTVTPRGIYKSITFDLPDDFPQEIDQIINSLSQSLDQTSTPFPTEPVGIGARWRVVGVVEMGAQIVMMREFEVVALDGDLLTLRVTGDVKLVHDNDPTHIPGMPEGATMTFDSISGSVNGKTIQDLHNLMPNEATLTQSSTVTSTIGFDEDDSKIITQIDLVMKITTPAPIDKEKKEH